jgi:hypothetical protein
MSAMRRVTTVIVPASTMILAVLLLVSCGARSERVGYYFYEIVCPGCEESQRMAEYAGALTAWANTGKRLSINTVDVLHAEEGFDVLGRLCDEYEVDLRFLTLPVLFLDGEVYRGFDEIGAFLDTVNE